jgi:hypothetical protein
MIIIIYLYVLLSFIFLHIHFLHNIKVFIIISIAFNYTRFFTSDNEPDGTENATHNTFAKLTWIFVFLFKKT